jgi:asparagine synthase (glutamine-hydrolysing)
MVFGSMGKSHMLRMKQNFPAIVGSREWNRWVRIETDFFFLCFDQSADTGYTKHHLWISGDGSKGLFWDGEIYNWQELLKSHKGIQKAQLLWTLYQDRGSDFLQQINGSFILFSWDKAIREVLVARDKIGLRELFYSCEGDGAVFGTHLGRVSRLYRNPPELNLLTLLKYLVFCYNPGSETFYQGIRRLRPGHVVRWKAGKRSICRYWNIPFDQSNASSEAQIGDEIRDRLSAAVKIRNEVRARTGAFLSGGLDSSSIVSILHSQGKENLSTYSFRCRGESFDESRYAQIVADTFHTNHQLVEYSPEDVLLASEMVGFMEEPFCDVGINIATYLLSRAVKGNIDDLFTGDGGDELFAGHPVYTADKAARLIDWIPGFIRNPFLSLGQKLGDSDKKKDWKVKVKRFSKSAAFPKELGTHRWRAYYLPEELRGLVNPDLIQNSQLDRLYEDIIEYNREGKDFHSLGQSLYSDYQTVVQYYLRRMELPRAMGIRPKFPMLDPDVVTFCATIPSRLKIQGFSDSKYIEKIAVRPLLPGEIVDRKDKLGHSIPLKNWMRDNEKVKDFFKEVLSKETLRKRGFFNTDSIERMMTNHLNKSENNSHRLWALVILELWMQHSAVFS